MNIKKKKRIKEEIIKKKVVNNIKFINLKINQKINNNKIIDKKTKIIINIKKRIQKDNSQKDFRLPYFFLSYNFIFILECKPF